MVSARQAIWASPTSKGQAFSSHLLLQDAHLPLTFQPRRHRCFVLFLRTHSSFLHLLSTLTPRCLCFSPRLPVTFLPKPVAINDNCLLEALGKLQIPLVHSLRARGMGNTNSFQLSCLFLCATKIETTSHPAWSHQDHSTGFPASPPHSPVLSAHAKTKPHLVRLAQGPANSPPTFTGMMLRRLKRKAVARSARCLQPYPVL